MARSEITDADRPELARFIERHWNSQVVMSKGKLYYPHKEQGVVERRGGEIVGVLTYHVHNDGMEVLTLNSTLPGHGIGSALMLMVIEKGRKLGCPRIWLTTTNDNLHAIGFYQQLGFRMTEINVGAVDEARKMKPAIPLVGERGIAIHDEIVLTLQIEPFIESEEAVEGEGGAI